MSILFIADLHLSPAQPQITGGFLQFLAEQASETEALYILGDLFETWIGDDDLNPLHQTVAEALAKLHQQGVPCYFIHGNRDFLLGQRFAKQCHLQLLPEEYLVDLYGETTLILHGDTLCSEDISYQRFRRIVNNRLLQRFFLCCPLSWRLKIATLLRRGSQTANSHKTPLLMDVTQQTVETRLNYHGVTQMIHGHTHAPAIHHFPLGDETAQRAVLGAWHQQGSVLRITPDGYQLMTFPLTSA